MVDVCLGASSGGANWFIVILLVLVAFILGIIVEYIIMSRNEQTTSSV